MLPGRTLRDLEEIRTTRKNEHFRVAKEEIQRKQKREFLYGWTEDVGGIHFARARKQQQIQMRQERNMANKAIVLVRRAALQKLLQDEHRHYQEELNRLGKSFYVERL
ncbi:cilia- and flagella-associated protein 141 [Ascaphus truei]|uniref:cilia- and flagella-associated protein 141 n=1 Tax=Ascaphus truei TaxID=8439 RepID=UPI003F5AB1A9